jgi:hypothetical protein
VQATDEYAATRHARLVLIDSDGVRATMTASWLRQMGWAEAVVLAGGITAAAALGHMVKGKRARPELVRTSVTTVRPPELARWLAGAGEGGSAGESADLAVIDVGTSIKYRNRGHIPGSWWAVRSRLDQARAVIGAVERIVFTSTVGTLAKLAAADAHLHWPEATIYALTAGNKGWRHAGYEMEPGFTRPTTEPDDVWYKPYDHADAVAQHMRDYLAWEVALVEQLERDPAVTFPTFA